MQKNNKIVKAVVGILKNTDGEILLAERRQNQFMAGYWELPGGKIEAGESNEESLAREFKEELDVDISEISLFHTMRHHYPEKTVHLWIYSINHFDGEVRGAEGQSIVWCPTEGLNNFNLLPTMKAIIHKINLPELYWITPENLSEEMLINELKMRLNKSTAMIQLRAKATLDPEFIKRFYDVCHQSNAKLILNTTNKTFMENCDGWHLTTQELLSLNERPCGTDKLLGASTHNVIEAQLSEKIDVDYISISPIQETQTHPNATPFGWEAAKELVHTINIPVYLLGGMQNKDLEKALKLGAQGIAGLSSL